MLKRIICFFLLFSYLNIIASVPGYSLVPKGNIALVDKGAVTDYDDPNDTLIEIILEDLLHLHDGTTDGPTAEPLFHYTPFSKTGSPVYTLKPTPGTGGIPVAFTDGQAIEKQTVGVYANPFTRPGYYNHLFRLTPF